MKRISVYSVLILMVLLSSACRDHARVLGHEPLISAGDTVITVGEFNKALEITKTAYPYNVLRNKKVFNAIKMRLLSQMIEELVITKVADEKKITVTDEEFNAAVSDIKKDYPEGVFEELLLENAISEYVWTERLRKRMLMEKVVNSEFDSKISVSPSEMQTFYDENAGDIESEFEQADDESVVYDRILKRIKMDKKQGAYKAWIEQKKADYSIEVNQKIWEKIHDS